jgi:transcriptional regulator with XRE-family HTH domain
MNEKIAQIRQALGLNQTEFAKKLGLTSANISSIEHGKSKLTEVTIRLICFTFGVREEWLREGKGEMLDEKTLLSEYEKHLLDLFHKLSPLAQDWLIERAEEMLKSEMFSSGSNQSPSEFLYNAPLDKTEQRINSSADSRKSLPAGDFEEERSVG